MELLDNIQESIASDKQDKIAELEKETKAIQENNPFKISDELSMNGFVETYDALYRLYVTDGDGKEYYLKISRDGGKKFKLNYSWCIKEDNDFNVVSGIFTSTKTIYENIEKRNKILGKYTKDYNIPRSKETVAEFLNETWQLIIGAKDYLEILKDADTEYNNTKYSSTNIMQEYMVLSDVATDGNFEFRLLYVKDEEYDLFAHNVDNGADVSFNFKWQESPSELLSADETDAKIELLLEKLHGVEPTLDVFKIKDELLKSILVLDKDINKKLELLNNASNTIKQVIVDAITTLRNKHFDNLTGIIKNTLSNHKSPSIQMLADCINASDEFFVVHDIKKKFKRTPHGFVEITLRDISNFFNNEFGFNKISMSKCNECMDYITRELTIDYDIIQFKNGLYNTRTCEFYDGKYANEYIPKLNLTGFCYHEDAKDEFFATELYKELHAILKTDRELWKNWNEKIFFKSVGSCYHGVNIADKLFVLVGKSWSRKSTLLSIIKRIFADNYCNKKIQEIVKNERFVLVPTVNKAILIDDDASDLQITNIGNLNSFISGTGLYVEFKNANDGVHLNEYNTPRIWCASNELFNVVGSGFKRRLCLILCDNVFSRDESSKEYMVAINNGERDTELELMISYCIQLMASEKDSAFLTQEQEDAMSDEFEFRSYAERRFVQDVFAYADEVAENLETNTNVKDVDVRRWYINYTDLSGVDNPSDASDNNTNANITKTIPTIIKIKDSSTICRKYLNYQRKQGTIFDSQAIPSSKKIKTALEMFGFNQTTKNITTYGKRSSIRVYENIVVKDEWIEKLNLQRLVDNIVENDLMLGRLFNS